MLTQCLYFFGALVAAGFGAPIPEELPVIWAGLWAADPETVTAYGNLRFIALPVCILGVVIADGCLYGIGRYFGPKLLNTKFAKRFVPPEKRAKIEENYNKHGVKILLFARLTPGIRAPMFVMSGVMRLPLGRFIFADGIYAIPGVSLLFFLAYWMGEQFRDLIKRIHEQIAFLKPVLIIALLTAIIAFLLYKFLRKPVSDGEPPDLKIGSKHEINLDKVKPTPAPSAEAESHEEQEVETPRSSLLTARAKQSTD